MARTRRCASRNWSSCLPSRHSLKPQETRPRTPAVSVFDSILHDHELGALQRLVHELWSGKPTAPGWCRRSHDLDLAGAHRIDISTAVFPGFDGHRSTPRAFRDLALCFSVAEIAVGASRLAMPPTSVRPSHWAGRQAEGPAPCLPICRKRGAG